VRLLYRVIDDELFARAVNRRDFVRVSDGALWAHESHDWLVATGSGVAIAHRTGHIYYGAEDGLPVYYEASEPPPNLVRTDADTTGSEARRDDRRVPGR
jgi:hypothetical protein